METGTHGVYPTDIPKDPNVKLVADQEKLLDDPKAFRMLAGKLIYLTNIGLYIALWI